MRESITFPHPHPRPWSSVVKLALLGALLLVLIAPSRIHAQRAAPPTTVLAGTTILVELLSELTTTQPTSSRFATRLRENLIVDNRLVASAGSPVYGVITRSEGGFPLSKEVLVITLDQMSFNGRLVSIVTDTAGLEAKLGGEMTRLGSGTLVGAVFAGGAGAAFGGAASAASTTVGKGQHISMPAGAFAELHVRKAVYVP